MMTTEQSGPLRRQEARRSPYWASMLPLLQPAMLLPRIGRAQRVFPFDQPNVQYLHFARNAIYFLARHFGLTGQDVLVPAYFHGVEVEALMAAGAVPRFYPVHAGMRVDPQEVESLLRAETRAVCMIHYLGFPGPIIALRDMCRRRGVVLIEDCALALLSKLDDAPLGSFGDAAVFSLYKTLPTPDGGAVVLRTGQLELDGTVPNPVGSAREAAMSIVRGFEISGNGVKKNVARTLRTVGRAVVPSREAVWVDVGTQRFRLSDTRLLMSRISRNIVASQDFDNVIAARRRNYLLLESMLRDLSPPVFADLPPGVCPSFYPFATARKRELWRELRLRGIEAVLFWLPGDLSPPSGQFPEVDTLRETVLELPCHQDLTVTVIERIAHTVRASLRSLGQ